MANFPLPTSPTRARIKETVTTVRRRVRVRGTSSSIDHAAMSAPAAVAMTDIESASPKSTRTDKTGTRNRPLSCGCCPVCFRVDDDHIAHIACKSKVRRVSCASVLNSWFRFFPYINAAVHALQLSYIELGMPRLDGMHPQEAMLRARAVEFLLLQFALLCAGDRDWRFRFRDGHLCMYRLLRDLWQVRTHVQELQTLCCVLAHCAAEKRRRGQR